VDTDVERVFAHTFSLSPHRQSRANRAGLVAVYLPVG